MSKGIEMTAHNLPPQHQEVAQKATDRIKQSIARVLFKATEGLEPTINVLGKDEEHV